MLTSRRSFFQKTGSLAAAALAAGPAAVTAPPPPALRGGRPQRFIHLVADGMSSGTLACADHFSQLTRGRGLTWFELCHRPETVVALVNMRSLNSLVTDSAAAASSWGCGSRVANGSLNQLPDGRDLEPLYSLLRQAGWGRALVTTTEITHATPAGFAANGRRDNAEDVAAQYLARGVDILLGGGAKFFDPAKRKDQRDLRGEFRAAGYAVMDHAGALASAPNPSRWLGTFAPGHLPFSIDRAADATLRQQVPTLATMTGRALEKLEGSSRFALQVEGGRVDHGCHACDIVAALHDMIAFDEALEVCLEFQRRQPETLLVVTTDHGTGNPGLNGTGDRYGKSSAFFANTRKATCSFEELEKRLTKQTRVADLKTVIEESTGYRAPDAKLAQLATFLDKKGTTLYDSMNSVAVQLGQLLGNHLGVGWSSSAHTSDYVPLLALGPGAERFRGFLQNVDVFHHYLDLASIDYRNPALPLQAGDQPETPVTASVDRYA